MSTPTIASDTRYRDLAKAMKFTLIEELTPLLAGMIRRWKADDIFDQTERRRRMKPSHSRDVSRERATAPNYTRPGRS